MKNIKNISSFYLSFCLNKKKQKFKIKIWAARLTAFYRFYVSLRCTKSLNARFIPNLLPFLSGHALVLPVNYENKKFNSVNFLYVFDVVFAI